MAIFVLNVLYVPFKIFCKTQNKITYISRESNTPSIDFNLLNQIMGKRVPLVKQEVKTKMIGKSMLIYLKKK